MPMLVRSEAEKRARTLLLRSTKVLRRDAPVQGLRGSFLEARRPRHPSIGWKKTLEHTHLQ